MLTVTSKEVQSHYGEFLETVQDDLACVTRHGRPLFWAISDRHVRDDPGALIGRLLLLNGQLRKDSGKTPSESFGQFLEREVDQSINPAGLSASDVSKLVNESRG